MVKKTFDTSDKAQYWSEKNSLKPAQVTLNSHKKFWFDCDKCGHEFESSLNNITNCGSWCPYCAHQKLCGKYECISCFQNSFASSDKAKFWSNKNELQPSQVTMSSGKKFWFDCDKCGHEFESSLDSITGRGRWCPYCVNQKRCSDSECIPCFQKSFASSDKAKFWSSKNRSTPRDNALNSNKKFLFDCDKCGHGFDISPGKITISGNWCPYCANQKRCIDSECISCFQNSFASFDKAKFWSSKNGSTPRDNALNCNKKFWFKCEKSHEFQSALNNITSGSWCPLCHNKTEGKLKTFLQEFYPSFVHQYHAKWCKNAKTGRFLPFDFASETLKTILELDGRQHFVQVGNWVSPGLQQIRDCEKEEMARQNGFRVIRILQEDVWNDKTDWKQTLHDMINGTH